MKWNEMKTEKQNKKGKKALHKKSKAWVLGENIFTSMRIKKAFLLNQFMQTCNNKPGSQRSGIFFRESLIKIPKRQFHVE